MQSRSKLYLADAFLFGGIIVGLLIAVSCSQRPKGNDVADRMFNERLIFEGCIVQPADMTKETNPVIITWVCKDGTKYTREASDVKTVNNQ